MLKQQMLWLPWSREEGSIHSLLMFLPQTCPLLSLILVALLWIICQVTAETFDPRGECKTVTLQSGEQKDSDLLKIIIFWNITFREYSYLLLELLLTCVQVNLPAIFPVPSILPQPQRHCLWDLFPHPFALIHPGPMRLATYHGSAQVKVPLVSSMEEEARSQIGMNN